MIIDCDTHVIESEEMWSLLDPSLYKRRPLIIKVPDDTYFGDRNAFWLIDGHIHPRPAGRGSFRLHTPATSDFELSRTDTRRECRELTDVAARLSDMDQLGVDVQVVYPTFFLQHVTDDPALHTGLCRAWNEWMARVYEESDGRIRWVVVPPLYSFSDCQAELRAGKARGAVGVFMHGQENQGSAASSAFFPLYEEARQLDLPICIHTGNGSQTLQEAGAGGGASAVMAAFNGLITNSVPEQFPGLRFGFIEAGAGWIPDVFHGLARSRRARSPRQGRFFTRDAPEPWELMREYNLFVACEADEDLSYILTYADRRNIVIGSDYGHVDPAFEEKMAEALQSHKEVDEAVLSDILSRNAAELYGLSETAS